MANAITIPENERQSPHGNNEPVPHRETGIGLNTQHPMSPLDDDFTKKRRSRYGEDPAFSTPTGRDTLADSNVNDTKTPNNPTRDERIRGSNSDSCPETGFGRAMSA
jgi:hypothetical protein